MKYNFENRLVGYQAGRLNVTYTYSGYGLKRLELVNSVATTLVWDGTSYLQGRS